MTIQQKLDTIIDKRFGPHFDIFEASMKNLPDGMVLEFGVASGSTINRIANLTDRPVYGFDSWEGLPEDWRHDHLKGMFAGNLPSVPDHVTLVQGLFQDTLPSFLEEHKEPVAFIHLDADLYSSTKFVLDHLGDRLFSGSIVIFDELWYPSTIPPFKNYKEHEYKAFVEYLERTGFDFEYIGNRNPEAFAFRLI